MRAFSVALVALGAAALTTAINPVDNFKPAAYLGLWYEIAHDLSSDLYESHYCVAAEYGLNSNGTVSVLNRQRLQNVTGPIADIYGWASLGSPNPAELTVHLDGVPFPAPYWVVGLGPMNTYNGSTLYSWAIVSDPFEISLFVLARDVTEFYSKYNTTVFSLLDTLGFNTTLNSPQLTQQIGCPLWP